MPKGDQGYTGCPLCYGVIEKKVCQGCGVTFGSSSELISEEKRQGRETSVIPVYEHRRKRKK